MLYQYGRPDQLIHRYSCDVDNRIVQARSLSEYGSNGYVARAPGANKYDVDYTYDPNEDRALKNNTLVLF